MDELMMQKYLIQIIKRQEIQIEQLSSICTALAKIVELPIENEECGEDELIGLNK